MAVTKKMSEIKAVNLTDISIVQNNVPKIKFKSNDLNLEIVNRIIKKDRLLINSLWDLYYSRFSSNDASAILQCCFPTKEMFFRALFDEGYIKFILYQNKKIVAFAIAATTIEKALIGVINPNFYQKFILNHPNKNFYYFINICIELNTSARIIKYMFENFLFYVFYQQKGIAAFDMSENNCPNMALVVENLAKKYNLALSGGKMDSQITNIYWANL